MKVFVAITGTDARDLSTGLDGELVVVPAPVCEYGADCLCVDSGCRVFTGLTTGRPTTVAMIANRDITTEDYTATIARYLAQAGHPAEKIEAAAATLATDSLAYSDRDVCAPGAMFHRVRGGAVGHLDQRVTVTPSDLAAAEIFITQLGGDPVTALRAVARYAEMGVAYVGREDVASLFEVNGAALSEERWTVIARDLDGVNSDLADEVGDWIHSWMERLGLPVED